MITFFRKFFQSKVGIAVTLGFLALIALAFASSDVANTGMFGGVAGGDRVANVGDRTITTAELTQNANSGLNQLRQSDPTITMEDFVEQGFLDEVLDSMIGRSSLAEFAQSIGLRVSQAAVNSELRQIPQFNGLDGQFDAENFRRFLQQNGLSEERVLDDLSQGLYSRQLIQPLSYGAALPASLARRYAELENDTRRGSAAAIPAAAFAPEGDPTREQLASYYQENREDFVRPERRVLRYAVFGEDAIGNLPPVTNEQVARRYQRDAGSYAASEQRSFTQLVLPTEAAARAVIDEVGGGVSLEQSARSKGLETASLESLDREALAQQASASVAEVAFSANGNALAGPVEGELGWYVLRVDDVTSIPGQTLEQASDEIRAQIERERRDIALNELTERLENELQDGRSLSEVAEEIGVELVTTPPLTREGQIYGTSERAPQALGPVINFAFQMEEGSDPLLTEVVPGEQFLIFDVAEVTPRAPAPLTEITDVVTQAWRRDVGLERATEASARIVARVREGMSLAEAVAAEDVDLPPPDNLALNRRELREQGQQSEASALFFSMAEGSAKRVLVDQVATWFVIALDEIEVPELAADAPEIANTGNLLAEAVAQEYSVQFLDGARESLDVEINEAGLDAVRAQLTGAAN
ncbi:peptidylprolyl isomerase [Aurantiacibacter poecillastricola]|uniref:peptidylprolyl isomerase n=1 Tax=Aurantiacibacter poecillastricola TaxID=3064385 RepID=UPI00273F8622|nr:peptidylprolyl isomerase [Aurantiacibacter sp. 219JJ12-13]MDP5262093.1 SurA N-terminal domain-containing protein [Aurantiacibacter sp. 219JJ12-13]